MDTPQSHRDDELGLEVECATLRRMLPSLQFALGWFALIQDHHLIGLFQTMVGATDVGYRCFGITLFLVRKIEAPAEELHIVN
jgi:hypothetical protein